MAKEKGMGKGLSALLGEDFSADFSTPSSTLPVSHGPAVVHGQQHPLQLQMGVQTLPHCPDGIYGKWAGRSCSATLTPRPTPPPAWGWINPSPWGSTTCSSGPSDGEAVHTTGGDAAGEVLEGEVLGGRGPFALRVPVVDHVAPVAVRAPVSFQKAAVQGYYFRALSAEIILDQAAAFHVKRCRKSDDTARRRRIRTVTAW